MKDYKIMKEEKLEKMKERKTIDDKCPFYDKCPVCGGKLNKVFSRKNGDSEDIWWCENCQVAIDSSGGYTN